MSNDIVRTSKVLSLVLRHRPEMIGITLDQNGWVLIDDLINKSGGRLTVAGLEQAVGQNDKQRFAISEDGLFIRANQGHSVAVDLGLVPKAPPAVLFHGTATKFLANIQREGLRKRKRQHVHLSKDVETATKVGARHGAPVILEIAAGRMFKAGHVFWLSDNGVWLTDAVAPEFFTIVRGDEGSSLA